MEETPKPASRTKAMLKLLLKIAVTVACLWYVSGKIDITKAGLALQDANWFYLFLALIAFVFSKYISAIRLNIYFKNIEIYLPEWTNIRLYWLGMFYNLFLPGSIGGDAYKVILLNREQQSSLKKTTAAVLLDRFSGLSALGLILSVYGYWVLPSLTYKILLVVAAILGILILWAVIKYFFPYFLQSFGITFLLGLVVQFSQVIAVYLIMLSLDIPITQPQWIFIFLAAAVITVLPISLGGGLGTREFVFREGAILFGLDPELAVVVSLLFYMCTLIGSLPGLIYVFKQPLLKATN